MRGTIASLYRHPVKGLTPEPLESVALETGKYFPHDREFAVEVGPSGFDPAAPKHISKQRFTVLARFPQLARVKARLDDQTGNFHVGDAYGFGVNTRLDTAEGRQALERFLQAFLGDEASGQLRVLESPRGHAFMDHPQGHVSVINLASVRAVESVLGVPVDPLRFRANIYVEGWPAWAEDGLKVGDPVRLGDAHLSVFKPIVRCVATHANTETGIRDIDMVDELRRHFSRETMGIYLSVATAGRVARGDAATA